MRVVRWLAALEHLEALVYLRRLVDREVPAPLRNADETYEHIERSILAVDWNLDEVMRLLLNMRFGLLGFGS